MSDNLHATDTEATTKPKPAPGCFLVARRLFTVALGLIFFSAFVSLGVQVRGLFGVRGIMPIAELLPAAQHQLGSAAWIQVPSLCWLNASDGGLVGLCVAGAVVSLILAAGWAPGACALLCWTLYLSFCAVGSPFLDFQWDALLLETAFLAIFYLPWSLRPDWRYESLVSRISRWLLWWLLFRLMFESGVVKLSSGDSTWRDLSALDFHFETQPLPLWTAWIAHHLPRWTLRVTTVVMFVIELGAPFLIVAPHRWRHIAALAMIALQAGIAITGNYAFFNYLTIALCLLLLDDAVWPRTWRTRFAPTSEQRNPAIWPLSLFAPAAAIIVMVTAIPLLTSIRRGWQVGEPLASVQRTLFPLRSFNGYGLFAVMTTNPPRDHRRRQHGRHPLAGLWLPLEARRPTQSTATGRPPSTTARLANVVRRARRRTAESMVRKFPRASPRRFAGRHRPARLEPISPTTATLRPRGPLRLPFHRGGRIGLVEARRKGPLLPSPVTQISRAYFFAATMSTNETGEPLHEARPF